MSQYAIKTCYDCGIKKPANEMERVTESYNSGQSNTKVTAGNLAWAALGDKRGQNAVGRAFKANNRRSYTRNRTVWKCLDCSGHNEAVANAEAFEKVKASGGVKMSIDMALIGQAVGAAWFMLFLFLALIVEFLYKVDVNDTFMWISAIGSLAVTFYFGEEEKKIEEAIKNERSNLSH